MILIKRVKNLFTKLADLNEYERIRKTQWYIQEFELPETETDLFAIKTKSVYRV